MTKATSYNFTKELYKIIYKIKFKKKDIEKEKM